MMLLTNILVIILFLIVMGSSAILLQVINHKDQSPKEALDSIKKRIKHPRTKLFLLFLVIIIVAGYIIFVKYV